MPLFVILRPGVQLDAALSQRIRHAIAEQLGPRYVPDDVIPVPDIPRTLSGKKMELPIKKLLLGKAMGEVASPGAMANPEIITWYQEFARQRDTADRSPAGAAT